MYRESNCCTYLVHNLSPVKMTNTSVITASFMENKFSLMGRHLQNVPLIRKRHSHDILIQ